MQKRPLGNTGIQVSEIAFGGVEIGMPYGIDKHMPSAQESIRLLRKAYDAGMNFFDTARLYGRSEELMGEAFAGIRQDVVLCTKCVHFKDKSGHIPAGDALQGIVNDSLHDSLKALKTDYIDVFMLHLADKEILANGDVTRIFTDLRASGRVRAIGVSVYTAEETRYAIASGVWDVVQLPFNLLNQEHGQYFDLAKESGVGVVVRSVLMQGMLSEQTQIAHPALQRVDDLIARYAAIARANRWSLAMMATKFALHFKQVSAVLIGIDRIDYLNAALAVSEGDPIGDDVTQSLVEMAYDDPAFINLHQWKQQGWI